MGKFKVVAKVRSRLREASGAAFLPGGDDSPQLSNSCVKAAKKMLDLFGTIDQAGKLTRFSFTDFQGCSIATMILLVAGILERDLCYETRISFGLDCLRSMAGEHVAAINGVHLMETLVAIANEATEKLRKYSIRQGHDPQAMPSSGPVPLQQDVQPTHSLSAGAEASIPLLDDRSLPQAPVFPSMATTWTEQSASSGDPFSLLQFDNEAFLMELTELEMLGMSGS